MVRGRLAVVQAPDGKAPEGVNLVIYDLDEQKTVESFQLKETPNTVVASGGRRLGALIPDGPALPMRFVDGGVRWAGGEATKQAPSVLSFELPTEDAWPFSAQGSWVSIFEFGGVARFVRVDEGLIKGSPTTVNIDTGNPHFGFGAALGDVLFTTVASEPDGDVVSVRAHDTAGKALGEPFACPGASGRAVLPGKIAFTCADGILVIREGTGGLSGKKTAYPDADRFVGDNFFAFQGLGVFAGDYRYGGEADPAPPPRLMRFDPETEVFSFLDLPGDYWALRPEPHSDGAHLVVLDGVFKQVSDVGNLRVIDVKDWKDEGTVAIPGLNYTGPWGWFSRLAVGPGWAYVSASLTGEIVQIELATRKTERITLGGSPGELDLLGIRME